MAESDRLAALVVVVIGLTIGPPLASSSGATPPEQRLSHRQSDLSAVRTVTDTGPRLSPGEPLFNEGIWRARHGDLVGATTALQAALALEPANPFFHYNLGVVLGMRRQITAALTALRKTVELHPGYTPAHFRIGLLLESTGQYEEAVRAYQLAIASGGTTWEVAVAQRFLGRLRQSLSALAPSLDH